MVAGITFMKKPETIPQKGCVFRDAFAPDAHQAYRPPTGRENCSDEQHEPENIGREKVTTNQNDQTGYQHDLAGCIHGKCQWLTAHIVADAETLPAKEM